MSEREGDPPREPIQKQASFQKSRWPGLIWAVPVAALGIVGWLALQAVLHNGPSVTVTFPVVGGLHGGRTKVKFRGAVVGRVTSVHLAHSLKRMTLHIRFAPQMSGHLGPNTEFWIAGKSVSLAHISTIKTLISGPYIGIKPNRGTLVHHFIGRISPPLLTSQFAGETFTLVTHKLHHISRGSDIYYRHFKVGKVRGFRMTKSGDGFKVFAFIRKPYEKHIHVTSRFWNASAIGIDTKGPEKSVQLTSLPALLIGALAFGTPKGQGASPAAKPGAVFRLYPNRAAALNIPPAAALRYRLVLAGGPQHLERGAPVVLYSRDLGFVTAIKTAYDPQSGRFLTTVQLGLSPKKIPLAKGYRWHKKTLRSQMNALLQRLISQGLRAQVSSQPPILGSQIVKLVMVPKARPAQLVLGPIPTIPATGTTGVTAIITKVNAILTKIDGLPLPAIAHNIHEATQRLALLSRSLQTQQTLKDLHQTMRHIDAITTVAGRQVPGILANIRASARDAHKALHQAQDLLGQGEHTNAAANSASLPKTLAELAKASRSLRSLTNYLDHHPSALLFGKSP